MPLPLLALALSLAAPPQVTNVQPRGLQRGQSIEMTVQGTNLLGPLRLLAPFAVTQEPLTDPKPVPTTSRLRVTVPATIACGVYPVRFAGAGGVTSTFLLTVDADPDLPEKENNDSPERAQPLTVPCLVSGQCGGGDVDFFRIPGRRGQRLVLETRAARLGAALLPQLRLTDAEGRFLAADDTQALGGDARLIVTPERDGDLILELSDSRYRGGNPPFYRLWVGPGEVFDEVFPLGGRAGTPTNLTLRGGTLAEPLSTTFTPTDPFTTGTSRLPLEPLLPPGPLPPLVAVGTHPELTQPLQQPAIPPVTINGRLTKPGQRESARVTVQPGTVYRIAIEAARFGSALDGVLTIRDSAGKVLTEIDDTTAPAVPGQPAQQQPDPSLKYTVPAGVNEIELGVRDQRGRGGVGFGYRLTIEPALPVFSAILTSTDHADRITGRGNGTECRECSECARASRSDRGPRHGRRDQYPGGTADGDRSVGTGA